MYKLGLSANLYALYSVQKYKNDRVPQQDNLIILQPRGTCIYMAHYSTFIQELAEDTPENVTVIPVPYNVSQTPEMQVANTYQRLQRSARRKDRITTLVHAYYLGELLEMNVNRPLRSYLNHQISRYYSLASRRTYYLFEKTGVEQIYRTRCITLRNIYLLPFSDYQSLIGS